MIKITATFFCLMLFLLSCNSNPAIQIDNERDPVVTIKNSQTRTLSGSWVRNFPKQKTIIEIKDTSHVFIYSIDKTGKSADTLFSTMGFFNDTTIWIHIPTARFDYRIKGDTLIEFDKMGTQGKYVKTKIAN